MILARYNAASLSYQGIDVAVCFTGSLIRFCLDGICSPTLRLHLLQFLPQFIDTVPLGFNLATQLSQFFFHLLQLIVHIC